MGHREPSRYHGRALPGKARTPAPPKRAVQAPKVRTAPRDPRRNRMILLVVAGSAVVIAAAVLGFLLLGGNGGNSAETGVAAKFRELGGTFETLPARPNFRFKGQNIPRHTPAAPPGFKYNSNPPSSGIHTNETIIYGIYDEPVAPISTVHNLEHGAIVIRYGPDVPSAEIEKLREWYLEDPNGLIVAPMPGLGDDIALTAWTYDRGRVNDRTYDGEGRVAKLSRFDEAAFSAFKDEFRGHGPENPPFTVSDLQPGQPKPRYPSASRGGETGHTRLT
jgi:hypothetical protein